MGSNAREETEQREKMVTENEGTANHSESSETGEEENRWSLVSPTKVGRSPGKTDKSKQSEDIQISASKFSILSVDDEEDGEILGERLQMSATGTPEAGVEQSSNQMSNSGGEDSSQYNGEPEIESTKSTIRVIPLMYLGRKIAKTEQKNNIVVPMV
ncbi:hypothetical protein F2Q69_00046799 [Brassica cretica]|uniref:Uncharacterized protein n=1 Tax=Brassica cretica TaxID=69181 RepID=A0A8S9PSG0_BRACR|nr:hypothetical protein F2Q69_00046799 [Brassica cretica]